VTCSAVAPACEDAIQVADVVYTAATGTLTITRVASLADYQTLLRTLRYNNTSANPNTTSRIVNVTVNDRIGSNNPLAVATVTLAAVNNAPTVTAPLSGSVAPGATLTFSTGNGNTVSVADADAGTSTLTITLTGTNGTVNLNGTAGLTGVTGQGTGLVTATGTLTDLNTALNGLTFATTVGFAGGSLQVQVNDNGNTGTGGSLTASRTINIIPGQPPVLANGSNSVTFTEPSPVVVLNGAITVTDPDSTNLASATATITGNYVNGQDVLAFTNTANITGVWDAPTGRLTLTGSDTVANYQAALRSVTYNNTSLNPSTTARTVTFQVNDGAVLSNTVTTTVNVTAVNTAPTVTTSGGSLSYTENDPAAVIDSGVTVTDPDSINISGATVQITTNCQSAQDVLSFVNTANISGTYTAGTCLMTLTGTDTVANYQAALRTVRYANSSDNPNTTARTVTFRATDSGSANSNAATRAITVAAVNDAPVLGGGGNSVGYTEGAAGVAINPALTLSDVDSTNLTGATITITGGLVVAQDLLEFTNTANISGAYVAATGTLTLSGTDTLANYQAALRTVRYRNTSNDPNTANRTISFVANDGAAANNLSNTVTSTVTVTAVNSAPTATNPGVLAMRASIPITFPAGTLGGTDVEAGTTITIDTTPQAGSVPTGASVTINANGSFTFVPPVGATGSIVGFAYRVSDNGNPAPGVNSAYQNVSFNITGPNIYYVKSAAAGAGNCTLANECTLATALTSIGATTGQTVFIGDANTYTNNVTLNANGRLFGQGVPGTDFDTVFGITAPGVGTIPARPAINQTRPIVTSSGVTLTLGTNNTVQGLNLRSTGGTTLFGNTIGNPSVADVSITGGLPAIDLSTSTGGTITLDSVTSTGGANGVRLNAIVGTVTINAGNISGATTAGFTINSGTANVTYGGTIIGTAGGRSVGVTNKTGGTVIFSGAVSDVGNGIVLSNNAGATINFTGGLALTTGTNPAFGAAGGGTINVTQNNTTIVNTITNSNGFALRIDNTNIGASGITFRSITNTGSTTNAIILNNTGTSGGLTVTGNGGACTSAANCTGGAIQNSTGDAISLTGTSSVALTDMYLFSSGGSHVKATTVNGLTFTRVFADLSTAAGVLGNGVTSLVMTGGTYDRGGAGSVACNVNGVEITNLLGTSTVTGTTFRRSNTIQFRVINNTATAAAGAPDTLTVSGTDWNTHNNVCAGDHLSVAADAGSNFSLVMNATGGRNTVNEGGAAATGGGIGVNAASNGGKLNVSVTGLKTTNNTSGVVIANTGAGGQVTFNITGNKASTAPATGFSGTGSLAVAVTHVTTNAAATTVGSIDDNSIVHTAGPSANAMQVVQEGGGTVTVRASNNTINGNFQRGFQGQSRLGTGTLNATLQGNTFTGTDNTNVALQVVNIETGGSGTGHGNSICLNMLNNQVNIAGATYLASYRLNSRGAANCTLAACNFRLQDFTGNGAVAADVQNWITTTKTNVTGGGTVTVSPTQAFTASAGNCPTAP
jgi:large repetitive protein